MTTGMLDTLHGATHAASNEFLPVTEMLDTSHSATHAASNEFLPVTELSFAHGCIQWVWLGRAKDG